MLSSPIDIEKVKETSSLPWSRGDALAGFCEMT
jgi:hypothetical protein